MGKKVFKQHKTRNKSESASIQKRKKRVKPISCYGLHPGSDLKHNKRTIFLVRGIGRVNRVAVLSRDKTDVNHVSLHGGS